MLTKLSSERIVLFFREVITNISLQELLVLIERNGYMQQIKSKTTFTETSVINIDTLMTLLETYSKIKLKTDELKAF